MSRARRQQEPPTRERALHRTVDLLGDGQLLLTAGILGVTSALAMQAGRSTKFSAIARFLP